MIHHVGDEGTDKRLLILETEFGGVLRVAQRQGNTITSILRQAWDGGDLRVMTKNNPLHATDTYISMIGHCTPPELRELLSSNDSTNGTGNRILWVCCKRSKALPDGGRIDADNIKLMGSGLGSAAAFARKVGEMTRTPVARSLWHRVYPELSEGRPGLAGALLGRGEAHVMRLACLYALLDESHVIDEQHLMAALAFWKHVEASVRYIWGDATGDKVADDILAGLRAKPEGMTRSEIHHLLSRNTPARRLAAALTMLLEHQLLHRGVRRLDGGDGRLVEVWLAGRSTNCTNSNSSDS